MLNYIIHNLMKINCYYEPPPPLHDHASVYKHQQTCALNLICLQHVERSCTSQRVHVHACTNYLHVHALHTRS